MVSKLLQNLKKIHFLIELALLSFIKFKDNTDEVIKEMETTPSVKGMGSMSPKIDEATKTTGNLYSFY